MSDSRRFVHADEAPAAAAAYSHAVAVSGSLLFCSGQIPLHPATGELVDGGPGDQATRCLENLEAVCQAAGTTLANAVRVGVFLTDLAGDFAEVNAAYQSFFGSADPPARAAVGVAALPRGARVEIDAIVALP
jgi:2-iminobutanoate/2-iminopropanoate deaminase